GVEAGELPAFFGHRVEVRRAVNFRAERPDVSIAEVVDIDDDEVRLRRIGGAKVRRGAEQERREGDNVPSHVPEHDAPYFFLALVSGGASLAASAAYSSNCFVQAAASSRAFSGFSFARSRVSERSAPRSYSSHGLSLPAATIFQSPARRARLPSCSHHSDSCVT